MFRMPWTHHCMLCQKSHINVGCNQCSSTWISIQMMSHPSSSTQRTVGGGGERGQDLVNWQHAGKVTIERYVQTLERKTYTAKHWQSSLQ